MNAFICLSHLTKNNVFLYTKSAYVQIYTYKHIIFRYFHYVFIIRLAHTYNCIHEQTLTDSNKLLAVVAASISLFNALNCAVITVITPLLLA